MRKVDDYRIVLLSTCLILKSAVWILFHPAASERTAPGRERMVRFAVRYYYRCICIIKRKGNIVVTERVVCCRRAMRNAESQQRESEHFFIGVRSLSVMLQHSVDGLFQPVALGAEVNTQVVFAVLYVVAAIFDDHASLFGEMLG